LIELEPQTAAVFAAALFEALGAEMEDAMIVAAHLVDSDRCGVHSHGLLRVPQYIDELRSGEIATSTRPEIVSRNGAHAVIDGKRAFGQVAAEFALGEAERGAVTNGVGLATVFGAGHAGRIGAYVERGAASGNLAVAFCSGPRSGHRVAAFGGVDGRLATNPIAFAFSGDQGPVIADFSTSTVPEGVIRRLRDLGLDAPEGSIQDAHGSPTVDPAILYADVPGTILPLGGHLFGHKGFALGLLVEAMTTVLAGENAAAEERFGNTLTILVIVGDNRRSAAGEALAKYVRSSRAADPTRPVLLPGDPERAARSRSDYVQIDTVTWRALAALAADASVDLPEVHT
jgi:uncharacterized oxidoreductase